MDPKLLELLARLHDEANPLTDEELAQVEEALAAVAAEVDPAQATTEDIEVLREVRENIAAVREVQGTRAAEAEERRQAAADLLGEIAPEAEAGGETAETETEAEETAEAETETPEGGEETVGAPAAEAEPEPVAASASGGTPARSARPALPSIGRLAARRPRAVAPVPTATDTNRRQNALVASADIPGLAAGAQCTVEEFAHGAVRKFEAVKKVRDPGADGEKIYFGTVNFDYPEDRLLDMDEHRNEEKIRAVTEPQALAASGGICAPVAVDYTLTTIAAADRPAKGALAQFGANRGGLRYVLPHTLAAVTSDGPASVWTQATDANPGNATKPHATFACQAVVENYVDAVTSIVQFGNFQARYFPEQIAQYLETVDAVHSRVAEANILGQLLSGSVAVTADNYELGATRDFLATVDRWAAGYRYRNRMNPSTPLRFVYPYWVHDMIRADTARQLPGDSGGQTERFATSDAEIAGWLRARNINASQYWDSPTGAATFQGFGAQGAGQLVPWPLSTICFGFHEGAWMFLDGGELSLGMVRDSTLNKTNDFQMFSETFEKAIFRGHETDVITMKIAPTGASAGTVATGTAETIGS